LRACFAAILVAGLASERAIVASISYSKLLDPVSDSITLMESLLAGAFGPTTGDQRECYKRIHAYCWGLHTLVMDVITALGIENAATRPAVLERFNALNHPIKTTLDNLAAGFDGQLSDEQSAVISFMRDSALAIEHMMSNLWQYSLLENDMITFEDREFDGETLINRLRTQLRAKTRLELDRHFRVLGDEARLGYAFGEIARNVRQHAGVDEVLVAGHFFGYRADLMIYDRGCGFPGEGGVALEPFWQAEPESPGLGLGLYIAKRFIEDCGGSINVSSRLEKGTLVKVSLPTQP